MKRMCGYEFQNRCPTDPYQDPILDASEIVVVSTGQFGTGVPRHRQALLVFAMPSATVSRTRLTIQLQPAIRDCN